MSQFSYFVRASLVVCIVACTFAWFAGMQQQQGYHQDRFKTDYAESATANAAEASLRELRKPTPTLAFIAATLCWISIQLELIRTKT